VAPLPDLGDLGEVRVIFEVTRSDGTIETYEMAQFIVADDEDAPCQPKKEIG
jgi:hypothetical protein